MTSREVTRFYLVTNDFNSISMTSIEVTRFYLVTKSTLYHFKGSY